MFNFKTKSLKSLVQLSKVHEGPVEASGYKVCTLGNNIILFTIYGVTSGGLRTNKFHMQERMFTYLAANTCWGTAIGRILSGDGIASKTSGTLKPRKITFTIIVVLLKS